MMPLAPHMSFPSIGHITAATATADNITTNPSKPKLTFSIDSIVGRKSSENNNMLDKNRPTQNSPSAHQKPKLSPINRFQTSSPPIKPNQMPSNVQHLSSPNQIRNASPLSTPSPILSVAKSSPYIDHNRPHPHQQQQPHPLHSHHSPIGLTGVQPSPQSAISHSMMMAATHHMSPIPQEYHQAVALYPWLLRANPFANRFHGMPFDGNFSSFLLPPFRKPKRIRTAFSPGQLLKLEQAFEKNHYVVGNERKQLANNLGLSETQVKVWFQNRRTKHKRQKQEEDEQHTGSAISSSDNASSSAKDNCLNSDDEEVDEDVDLEHDDDSEGDHDLISRDVRHDFWYKTMPSSVNTSSLPTSIASTSSLKI